MDFFQRLRPMVQRVEDIVLDGSIDNQGRRKAETEFHQPFGGYKSRRSGLGNIHVFYFCVKEPNGDLAEKALGTCACSHSRPCPRLSGRFAPCVELSLK